MGVLESKKGLFVFPPHNDTTAPTTWDLSKSPKLGLFT